MKLTYNIPYINYLLTLVGMLFLVSCTDNLPGELDSSANFTDLKAIRIVNVGLNGDVVLEGAIDHAKKTITFPRVDPETDFSQLKFEADLSDGASLDKESYSLAFGSTGADGTVRIRINNLPRYKEYEALIRLKVPVFGADFSNPTTIDYTNNPAGNPLYDVFSGAATRGSSFDGEHVLVVTRNAIGSHLLNVSDLQNNLIKPILLNQTGILQGTFLVNMGAQINGHTYIANLSGASAASPMKIYHWTDPSAAPQVIVNLDISTVAGAGARHGDHFSANLDDQGNGYFFFGDNAGTKVLRLKVQNYTEVTEPTVFAVPVTGAGSWTTYNRIGNSAEYIFTGHDAPIVLVNDAGSVTFQTSRTVLPIRSSDARVFNFNEERYLMVTTAARTGSEATNLLVYNITPGATVAEALANFNSLGTATPVFEYALMGPVNTSPSSHTALTIKKDANGNDESLVLFSAASDAGFVIHEFFKSVAED